MSIARTEMKRRPPHAGEILREDFLPDYGLTAGRFAEAIGVPHELVDELLSERCALNPQMALRLSRLFGNSAEFWLNVQRTTDLWEARQALGDDLQRIQPLSA
ncbi:HigA family addiction module antitoxin [Lentisalinibacter sediminis]|uniref:HigA family addiction module antitoxin n=1 Tax=Lentisalinibacter sediminis TaxID=2992237 RepID=UPI003866ABCB